MKKIILFSWIVLVVMSACRDWVDVSPKLMWKVKIYLPRNLVLRVP